ncbi:WD40 repeat protein [Winogradskyella epiphytica]|uniref:WD40 repeat protein n=1 Tax=Winogradskyella epiphytica TaxID=262005 RepID=A0A2V4Y0D1_9FLAO|nr:OmpA family protein [Winogradskyella epiphytica]PYE81868.1 WD40 repeat protein [Winogradskyella epiphytica]GGW62090.1 cell envelope biogenesis protein OmpA [Winogradskyella epiphytica]
MKIKFITFILLLSSSLSYSQTKLADKFFENYGYVKAIELYEKAVENGDKSAHVLTRLGDAYYNNSISDKAVYWYGEALKEHKNIEAEYIYKYIQSLRSIGNYEEADKWFKELSDAQKGDSRLKGYNPDEVDLLEKFTSKNDGIVVTLENVPFNTENSDFGGYVSNNILYYASAKADDKKLYSWNKEPFLDLFQVEIIEEGPKMSFGSPTELASYKVNTDYHEASVAITNDGKTLYFTRDNVNKRNRLNYDKEGTTHLKIYKAILIDGQWTEATELPFNDDKFSTGHPALSPDNTTLYFVSDREGGIGQTDIYSVSINEDGTYGTPENLGPEINTEGREMFPFVSKDNTLYFSSDGHLNLGLLDIFKSDILKYDVPGAVENLGTPFNSGYDDFAFYIDNVTGIGYFSSNRPGGKGGDDIYAFNMNECSQKLNGTAREFKTNNILADVKVQLIDVTGKVIEEVVTLEDGSYTFDVDCNKTYTIVGTKPDYKEDQKSIKTTDENEKAHVVDLLLTPLIKDNQIVINPIFFDFDKWNIRTDAQYELENIVDVMRKHPDMVIKIESHTDSRGRDKYNLKLSDRRAKSTRDYILSRGIHPSRIESALGFGETQLLNKCSNGVKCSEEEHQLNRRSYFYILDQTEK